MNVSDVERFIRKYFGEKGLRLSESTVRAILSRNFLNQERLESMSEADVHKNLDTLLEQIVEGYTARTAIAKRPTAVRDVDARPVLRARFCNLPPFCN